ncbi:unnamed protein product, partial [Sphacelaria rigidula]
MGLQTSNPPLGWSSSYLASACDGLLRVALFTLKKHTHTPADATDRPADKLIDYNMPAPKWFTPATAESPQEVSFFTPHAKIGLSHPQIRALLRLERAAWSMAKRLRQATNEY